MTGSDLIAAWCMGGFAALALLMLAGLAVLDLIEHLRKHHGHLPLQCRQRPK